MDTYVALLRGINLGGHHKLPMKNLAAMFEAAGCRDVRTYIQSGNVVFRADERRAATIAEVIREAIDGELGYQVPVVVRSAEDLARVVADNPFAGPDVDDKQLHIAFLAERPGAAAIAELDPQRSPPDQFEVVGREIFLRLPNGMARTKLTNAYFDRVLGAVSTVRNWRTANKLLELAAEAEAGRE